MFVDGEEDIKIGESIIELLIEVLFLSLFSIGTVFIFYHLPKNLITFVGLILIYTLIRVISYISHILNDGKYKNSRTIVPEFIDKSTEKDVEIVKDGGTSFMFYDNYRDKICIPEETLEVYYFGDISMSNLLSILKHEEGHSKRRFKDEIIEYSIGLFSLVIPVVIISVIDNIFIIVILTMIVFVIGFKSYVKYGLYKEKLADRYAIESGHHEGLLDMYYDKRNIDNCEDKIGYPSNLDRLRWLGEFKEKGLY
jgi:hypothetical protein